MSGPALRSRRWHSLIQNSAIADIEAATEQIMEKMDLGAGDARGHVGFLLDLWRSKVLSHAEEEENGLYEEIERARPGSVCRIERVKRDHEILAILVQQIEELNSSTGNIGEILGINSAMLRILELHDRDEEKLLPDP